MSNELVNSIRHQMAEILRSLGAKEVQTARKQVPGCEAEVARLQRALTEIDTQLESIPAIEIAFLGPSRHGKSTLLNALAAQSLLPTSDTRPCTASILRLKWAADWSVTVTFVGKEELESDLEIAIIDAKDYLERLSLQYGTDEAPDDPKYFLNTLQRFIQLFRLNREEDPATLLEQVRAAEIPDDITPLLGRRTQPATNTFRMMKGVVAKYLSTQDVYWTVVKECEIAGPFENWHENLSMVDLPGTNDSNPQRTAITNSLRENAQAVAIVTSDSNIGPDVESWLRNSSVLSEFIEAQSCRRQRLFIVRTKLDSYHPHIEGEIADGDEAEEERLYQEAFAKYKREQSTSFHEMLREMVLPRLPSHSSSPAIMLKRQELLSRVAEIPVHFVCAYAYEAFEGRASGITPRNLNRLKDHFSGDPKATGIPDLRTYVNNIAAEYLATNFYEDIQSRLESEVGLLAGYFQKESSTVQAELAGAGKSVRAMVNHVQNQLIPWIGSEVGQRTKEFQRQATDGGNEIRQRLDQVWKMSELRLADKQDKWKLYHWNSLRSTARKGGSHTTWRGDHIDINEDICGVLVGDVILAWTSYRDYLIQRHINELTDEFSRKLQDRLWEAAAQTKDEKAKDAINEIVQQLEAITLSQRNDLLRKVNEKVRQLQSIRAPAREFIQAAMASTFAAIEGQAGTGCQQRMRQILLEGYRANIDRIRAHIRMLVQNAVDELLRSCSDSLLEFGDTATKRIGQSVSVAAEVSRQADARTLKEREEILSEAMESLEINRFRSNADYWAWHNTLYPGGSSNSPEWRAIANQVKQRDGFACLTCGESGELHADHIIPLSRGGSSELTNLQTLCVSCHETKTGRPFSWRKSAGTD